MARLLGATAVLQLMQGQNKRARQELGGSLDTAKLNFLFFISASIIDF